MKYFHIIYLLLAIHCFESFGQSIEEIQRLRKLEFRLRSTSIDTMVIVKVPKNTFEMISRRGISLDEHLNSLLLKDALKPAIKTQDSKETVPSDDISSIRTIDFIIFAVKYALRSS